MSVDSHHRPDQEWPTYEQGKAADDRPQVHDHEQQEPAKRGGHRWMMILMCLPLVGIGVWQWLSGAGIGALLGGLMCFGMMAVMHLGMGGSSHRH